MKQKYEKKTTIDVCDVLDLDDGEGYTITIEDKDSVNSYPLSQILKLMEGQIVNIKSDIF